jgi:hypothetical protein
VDWITLVLVPLMAAVGALAGSLVSRSASGNRDTWDTLRWADDKLSSDDPNEVSRAYNHLDNLLTLGKLNKRQRQFARVSVRTYLQQARQEYLGKGSPPQVFEAAVIVEEEQEGSP